MSLSSRISLPFGSATIFAMIAALVETVQNDSGAGGGSISFRIHSGGLCPLADIDAPVSGRGEMKFVALRIARPRFHTSMESIKMPNSFPANEEKSGIEADDIVERFLCCAEKYRDRPAISLPGNVTTYAALRRRTASFACEFAKIESPRVLIGLGQEVDAYSAILAASWAGGYHTPLNIKAPTEKLARIARLLQPDFIVATGELGRALSREAPGARLLDPGSLPEAADFFMKRPRHHLAYVIFTSGSTGVPKGVMVPRDAVNHYVSWIERALNIQPADRVSQHANLAFDMSMTDIFGALCFGATLCPIADEGDRLMPARMIAREQITVWNSVPSVLGLMMQARQVTTKYLQTVRLFNFCGEPLLPEHLAAIFSAMPKAEVQNTYGPAEATVSMTAIRLNADNYLQYSGASVALGNPIPGMAIHLHGGKHEDEGEIVIEGQQLADGYWQDTERTAAAFRDLTVGGRRNRVYFTGDWAERKTGSLYFKERIDFQVKSQATGSSWTKWQPPFVRVAGQSHASLSEARASQRS